MGQDNSVAYTRDTFQAEQFLRYQQARVRTAHRAFQKCVAPSSKGKDDGFELTAEEKTCVDEYAALYAVYAKKGFLQFSSLFEQHQMDMQEKARQAMREYQARMSLGQQ